MEESADEDEVSGSEFEDEEDESEESEASDDDPEKLKFMKRPPAADDYNADGTLKFQPKSKLLLAIDAIGDCGADDDDVDNSFGEENSDDDDSDEDGDEDEDEEEEETSQAREHESKL